MRHLALIISASTPRATDGAVENQARDLVVAIYMAALGVALVVGPPLPIALALLVLAAALAALSPVAATAVVAASTPFIFHPVLIGGAQFTLLELSLLAGGFGLAVRLAAATLSHRLTALLRVLIGDWPTSAAAVFLITLGSLSLLTVADRRHLPESVRDLRVVIVEPIVALVLARWSLRHGGARTLVIGLLGAGSVVALVALVQVLTGRGEVIGNGVGRATGPYPHPNNLALYLERVGLFAAALVLVDRRWRRVVIPIALLVAAGLAATLSRGAMLAVIAGGALLLGMTRPARGWRWLGLAAVLVVLLFAATAGDRLFSTGTSGTTSSRELIWRASLQMVRDHPVFGVGLDQFLYQYAPRYVDPAGWPERYTSHPHNLILDVWLRLGLAGLVLLAGVVYICIRDIRRLRGAAERSDQRRLAVAGAALLVGGATHGLVDNAFFLPDLAVLTWIAVALIEPVPSGTPPLTGTAG
ncbi:MAG: hypothetical protein QOF33_1793 [Thermomicrobiales bacterium]|nr:hypothetical protein [Thermomicrobiales bacterium]